MAMLNAKELVIKMRRALDAKEWRLLENFKRKERCMDGTVFYDTKLEDHWWHVIDFVILVGEYGVVLNPTKLQFC